jgi:hypothetical protein
MISGRVLVPFSTRKYRSLHHPQQPQPRVLRDPSHPPERCPCTMVPRAVGVRGYNEFRASPLLIAHSDET